MVFLFYIFKDHVFIKDRLIDTEYMPEMIPSGEWLLELAFIINRNIRALTVKTIIDVKHMGLF